MNTRHSAPRLTSFRPPFCPNEKCAFHLPGAKATFRSAGSYTRSDGRTFPRFRCNSCERRFSSRAFSATYCLKKPHVFAKAVDLSVNGAGIRQSARFLGVSHSTVARHLARAGRHCLLWHATLIRGLQAKEPIVVDGFETYEYSQYHPFHINLAVGAQSWFLYGFTDSPLRRKGRMTVRQKRRRVQIEEEFGRPDPKAVENGILQLVSYLASRCEPSRIRDDCDQHLDDRPRSSHWHLTIRSDEHPAYPRALRRVRKIYPFVSVQHERTNSVEARTFGNPLFPVNLAELLLRHCHAAHRRETIAFAKRRQGAMERLASLTVWRNMIKRRREKGDAKTAAMLLGLSDRPLKWQDIFKRRLFPGRVSLPSPWRQYYWRLVQTLPLGDAQTRHRLRYAG